MDYAQLKWVHIGLAAISLAGFVLRWAWMMRGSALVKHRLTRVLPHVFDTLFLVSGITLVYRLQFNPMEHAWLAAKLGGLVVYITLASMAFKGARSKHLMTVLFFAALLCFAWVVSVARLKSATGFFSLLMI